MRLTVLNVAYSLGMVGPTTVGGAEQVLGQIDAAIVEAGHRSIVVAPEGSELRGELVATPRPADRLGTHERSAAHRAHAHAISEALDRWPVDVVHCHGVDCLSYLPATDLPIVITLHLPPSWYPPELFEVHREKVFLVPVSETQRAACPAGAKLMPVIPNGVPEIAGPTPVARSPFAVAMGRVCPEKGYHLAIQATRQAGVPLLIAGAVFGYPEHQIYFDEQIAPTLNGRVQFLGPIHGERKQQLLATARCVLIPSLAPETSSLVAMEAAMVGTPVIGFNTGALPEVIEHGRTGFVVNDVAEMAQAISRLPEIDSETCRAVARRRFAVRRMTDAYLQLYQNLAHTAPNRRTSMAADFITDSASLEALVPEWQDLWARCPDASPFQSAEWEIAWWREFGGEPLRTVTIRDRGKLVGLAPMYIRQEEDGSHRCVFLSTRIGDYLGPLIDPADRPRTLEALMHAFAEIANDCDALDLQELPVHSPLLDPALLRMDLKGVKLTLEPQSTCLEIPLDPEKRSFADYIRPSDASDMRRRQRRAQKSGDLQFETAGDLAHASELLDSLIALHTARWQSIGKPGVLAGPHITALHRMLVPRLLDAGMLRLSGMRLNGEIVAALYAIAHRRRLYCYLSGMAPETAKFGAGKLLLAHAVEQACQEGMEVVDLLRGREAYKYRWAVREKTNQRLQMQRVRGGGRAGVVDHEEVR